MKQRIILFIIIAAIMVPAFFIYFFYATQAKYVPANLVVDLTKVTGPFPDRWKALAQGGEQSGTRMLESVVPEIAELYPKYIRIDHIYDFYDVVLYNSSNNITLNFDKLDQTVCDIYHTGAKPFFSLGYMPPSISEDGSLIGKPKNWSDWSFIVQKTIEHYSGKEIVLPCGNLDDFWKSDIYYEVWNEPDLETFGKWHYGGPKSYSELYFYSSRGAQQARDVFPFKIGGPVTTALYKNWIQKFLDYVIVNKLRIDFLSWHHYSKRTNDYTDDIINLNKWLGEDPKYDRFENLPRVISEWGYSSDVDPIADTNVGAAHTLASLRNLLNARVELAFLFEIKDGINPSWGVITNDGRTKPRYKALQFMNRLSGTQVLVNGEGTYVTAVASYEDETLNMIIINYDQSGKNTEAVPVVIKNMPVGKYMLTKTGLSGSSETSTVGAVNGEINFTGQRAVIMPANTIIAIELRKLP